ncbi:MAG: hypothetical protein ABFD08_15120 [Syntrophomonas sp.]
MPGSESKLISDECLLPSTITIADGVPFRKRLRQLIKKQLGERRVLTIRRYTSGLLLKTKEENAASAEPVIITPAQPLKVGDLVRVRSEEEIIATLDQKGKLKGCGFMKNNGQERYCGSVQRVNNIINLFIDERNMSVARKAKGLVMLEGVVCEGGQGIGRCDRSCLMFWREEWLKKIEQPLSQSENLAIHSKPGGDRISPFKSAKALKAGDLVRVRSEREIMATLDHNGKLKGCSFIRSMAPYCETHQCILKPMVRYYSEIDERVYKCKGLFILEGVTCNGDTSLGHCDRSCLMFWREEWLEKVEN